MNPDQELGDKLRKTRKWFWIFQIFCGIIFINILSVVVITSGRVHDTYIHEKEGWIRVPASLQSVDKDYRTDVVKLSKVAGKQQLFPNRSRRISGYKYSYSYAYNGQTYNGSSFSQGSSLFFLQEATPYKVGEATLVWVNPNDPSKSFFDFPAKIHHFLLSVLITGVLMYLLFRWKKWFEGRHPELSFKVRTEFYSQKKNKSGKNGK
ncbi:DUF3592 domain-containing protein [Patescibacteria group bacterium]|nr:DUF3592 domain-containing protein [Patescibacteria group bacterium]